jgi:ABC-type multidrug transport system ATPase subunit
VAILHRGKLVKEGRVDDLVEEKNTESLVVEGLSPAGRAAVEATIKAQGGHLARVEKPRLSLDAFFLQEVHRRESEHAAKQQIAGGKKS